MKENIIKRYIDGESTIKISKNTNYSVGGIRKILIKNGVKLRSPLGLSRKYLLDLNIFEEMKTDWKSYFLGWLYSDGNIYKSSIRLTLCERDIDILDFFNSKIYTPKRPYKKIISKINTLNGVDFLSKNAYGLEISGIKLTNDIKKYGLFPNKSKTLRWPKNLDINYNYFLLGYFEGDGSVHCKGKHFIIRICSGSIEFINDLSKFLNDNNIENSITKEKTVYLVVIRKVKSIYNLYNFMYKGSPYFLSRKKEKFEQIIKQSTKLQNEIINSKGM